LKQKDFGEVQAYELGWSPMGRPAMTVHFYIMDGICIDTALRHMQKEVVNCIANHQVHTIVLTHHHEDHSGNAASLNKTLQIPILGHPQTIKKMQQPFSILPYQHYAWGSALPVAMETLPETVQSDHIDLKPIHTPGHSRDHTVFWEKNKGWLFSGDLFIAERIKYFRADEKMQDQIDSLKKVCQLDFDCLFCAHNPQIKNGKAKLQQKLQFLEDLYGRIKGFHAKGLGLNETVKAMGLKENYVMKTFCMGNLSMKNMVRSAFTAQQQQDLS
jgi:glyoxylase-like metal-dependent hydrolase (beta-lactamase superfamily II)